MKNGYYWFNSREGWIVVHVQGDYFIICGHEGMHEVAEEHSANFGPLIHPPTEN